MATGALTEQVAEELEQAAVVTRRLDGRVVGSFWIGVGVGVTIGFYVGYRYSKKKLRAEIYEEAEKEIAVIREHYQQKRIAVDAQDKPPVEKIIRDRGYAGEEETEKPDLDEVNYARLEEPTEEPDLRSLRAPVPISSSRSTRSSVRTEKDKGEGWDWEEEVARRDVTKPFIIHQDEYSLNESGYHQVSYAYYSKDDVLVDDGDPQTILTNRENLIGTEALHRFGHGSDDYNTVYVRNSQLELEFEINRIESSWEEDVLGQDSHETG